MNIKDVKKSLLKRLKEQDFKATPDKRLFLQDNTYFMIFVELEPCPIFSFGFYISVGVKFLWTSGDSICYDYHPGTNGRVIIKNASNPFGAILFGSPSFERDIEYAFNEMQNRIDECRRLKDVNILKELLSNRRDSIQMLNPGFEKKDVSLAISKMFTGEKSSAEEILANASETNPTAAALLEVCSDTKVFYVKLLTIINQNRKLLSKKCKFKLSDVASIWED